MLNSDQRSDSVGAVPQRPQWSVRRPLPPAWGREGDRCRLNRRRSVAAQKNLLFNFLIESKLFKRFSFEKYRIFQTIGRT